MGIPVVRTEGCEGVRAYGQVITKGSAHARGAPLQTTKKRE